jgi:hypothetical protein
VRLTKLAIGLMTISLLLPLGSVAAQEHDAASQAPQPVDAAAHPEAGTAPAAS